jgi:hypothetical protein
MSERKQTDTSTRELRREQVERKGDERDAQTP